VKYFLMVIIWVMVGPVLPAHLWASKPAGQEGENFDMTDQKLSLLYLGLGHENLKLSKFSTALDNFQKARALLSEVGEYSEGLKVLIFLGEIIALDRLGSLHDSLASLDELKSMVYADSECDQLESACEEYGSPLGGCEDCFVTSSDLFNLISLGHSEEVVGELSLIVNALFEGAHDQSSEKQPSCNIERRDLLDSADWIQAYSSVKDGKGQHKAKLKIGSVTCGG